MKQITKENLTDVDNKSLIVYQSSEKCIMKLQLLFADNWGFVNLQNPVGHINKNNTPSWVNKDFSSPANTVNSLLNMYPGITIYKLQNLSELQNLLP